jgi:hypothetical protein
VAVALSEPTSIPTVTVSPVAEPVAMSSVPGGEDRLVPESTRIP